MDEGEIRKVFPWARTVVTIDSPGDSPRKEVIASQGRARFVFISRLSEKKNLQLALEALCFVKADADFDIYGPEEDSDYWAVCKELMDELPPNIRANFLGTLRPDQVQGTFAQYDGFIFPTLGENFGHVIAESLSAGCPVICSQRTPWTGVLGKGGGTTLPELDPHSWADEINRRARETPSERGLAKQNAISAYIGWQLQQDDSPAVVLALDAALTANENDCALTPLRIALVTQGYESAGGVQTVARWLESCLRETGYTVDVFDLATSRNDGYSRRLHSPATWFRSTLVEVDSSASHVTHVGANAVEIEPLRYLPRAELSTMLSRYDLVQVVAGAPSLALVAAKCSSPIVLQVATTVASERSSQLAASGSALAWWRGAMTMATSLLERRALRRADAVLVENGQMLKFVLSVGQTAAMFAPPGVNTKRFRPRIEGWDPSGYLLSVCRLNDHRKGLERMIRSYSLMRMQRPEAPALVLAGRGELPTQLKDLISELDLDGHVSVRSDVLDSELPFLYQGASVYLQTSYEEGLGISVIEAMASGLPVVSTETAGSRVTVAHGETGWLVGQGPDVESTFARRTISVWSNDAQAMSRRARMRAVSLFSEEVTLSRFLEVYDRLLGCSREQP